MFRFLSGLYFRGKLAYGSAFARPVAAAPREASTGGASSGVWIITPGRGLTPPDLVVTIDDLRAIAEVGVSIDEPRFREPLDRDAAHLAATVPPETAVVLLGSIATGKYVDILERHFGERLMFPPDFVGRGDMSRGGLMLRCVQDQRELEYVPIAGATRHGKRPPRLEPLR